MKIFKYKFTVLTARIDLCYHLVMSSFLLSFKFISWFKGGKMKIKEIIRRCAINLVSIYIYLYNQHRVNYDIIMNLPVLVNIKQPFNIKVCGRPEETPKRQNCHFLSSRRDIKIQNPRKLCHCPNPKDIIIYNYHN